MDGGEEVNELTERVIGCAIVVSRVLGPGFLEEVYENALAHEMRKAGLAGRQQPRLVVKCDGVAVGDYIPDFIVDERVVIELKAVAAFDPAHPAQCLNALRVTGLHVGLILNFGTPRLGIKRVVHEL